jgi:hypothetical protein
MDAARLFAVASLGWALAGALSSPVLAKFVAEGSVNAGFCWQKIENSAGQVSYTCRAKAGARLSPAASCEAAQAKKP